MEPPLQSSLFEHAERRDLGGGAWVELRSGWLPDADGLFAFPPAEEENDA